jgi:hypothetical protein
MDVLSPSNALFLRHLSLAQRRCSSLSTLAQPHPPPAHPASSGFSGELRPAGRQIRTRPHLRRSAGLPHASSIELYPIEPWRQGQLYSPGRRPLIYIRCHGYGSQVVGIVLSGDTVEQPGFGPFESTAELLSFNILRKRRLRLCRRVRSQGVHGDRTLPAAGKSEVLRKL